MLWEFDKQKRIHRIDTRGNAINTCCFTKTYKLSYSLDNTTYTTYPKLFTGNIDNNGLKTQTIDPPIVARFVKFLPKSWSAEACTRVELYGCNNTGAIPP